MQHFKVQIHHSAHCHADVPHPTDGSVSVVALNEGGKVRVTWSRPTLGPGQVITGYSVQYRRRGTTSYTTHSVSGSSTTSYTITNLNLGAVYQVRVASLGPLGQSGYCCGSGKEVTTYNSECRVRKEFLLSSFTEQHIDCNASETLEVWIHFSCIYVHTSPPPVLPPDEVHSYPLPQPGTVRVTWTVAPNSTHGLTLVGYSVQYREEGGDMYQSQQVTEIPSPGELETFELEGLELRTTYELRVAVVTISGVGKYSDAINVTTYAGATFCQIHLPCNYWLQVTVERSVVISAHLSSCVMPVLIKCTVPQAAVSCCCSQ